MRLKTILAVIALLVLVAARAAVLYAKLWLGVKPRVAWWRLMFKVKTRHLPKSLSRELYLEYSRALESAFPPPPWRFFRLLTRH